MPIKPPQFKVVQDDWIRPPQNGVYASFPTVAFDPALQSAVCLYRQAIYDQADPRRGMRAHGLDGNLWLTRFDSNKLNWDDPALLFSGSDFPPGLIDGIINHIPANGSWHVLLRRFPATESVYHAKGGALNAFLPVKLVPNAEHFVPGPAEWGKIIAQDPQQGPWLQVLYGLTQEQKAQNEAQADAPTSKIETRPAAYASWDRGSTWHFHSWIAPQHVAKGICANETAILDTGKSLVAVMRTAGAYPVPMFMTQSRNGGQTWDPPVPTGFYGEAPMWTRLGKTGEWAALCIRGYRPYPFESEGGTFSIRLFHLPSQTFLGQEHILYTYTGNHYDGGYGDMVWLEDSKQLLCVHYASHDPFTRYPGIRFTRLQF